jgi:hypothetical protein
VIVDVQERFAVMHNQLPSIPRALLGKPVLPALVALDRHYSFDERRRLMSLVGVFVGERIAPCHQEKMIVCDYINGVEPGAPASPLRAKSHAEISHAQVQLVFKIIAAIGDTCKRSDTASAVRLWEIAHDFARSLEERRQASALRTWFNYWRESGLSVDSVRRVHMVRCAVAS